MSKSIWVCLAVVCSEANFAQLYVNGEFTINKIETIYDSIRKNNYIAYAHLYLDSVQKSESWHAGELGTIQFNATNLLYNSKIKTYHDTIQRTSLEGIRWCLNNAGGGLPSFSVSCTDNFPDIQGREFFPNAIRRNLNDSLTIFFGAVTNADRIELTMYDGVLRILFPFNRSLAASSQMVTIPGSDLMALEGNSVKLTLSLIKKEYRIEGNRRFVFEKKYSIVKTVPIINP